jgi:hypothetical protein
MSARLDAWQRRRSLELEIELSCPVVVVLDAILERLTYAIGVDKDSLLLAARVFAGRQLVMVHLSNR